MVVGVYIKHFNFLSFNLFRNGSQTAFNFIQYLSLSYHHIQQSKSFICNGRINVKQIL